MKREKKLMVRNLTPYGSFQQVRVEVSFLKCGNKYSGILTQRSQNTRDSVTVAWDRGPPWDRIAGLADLFPA